MLVELEEMGFCDKEMNKQLFKKNNGSIQRVVMDLIIGEQKRCRKTYEKENLCLYGIPNETWEVNLSVEEVPLELPDPALGINFARDGIQEKDWLSLVAVHRDSWMLSVAVYFGARFGFCKSAR
ncbi:PHD finger protein ALFIN-LIKE 6-like [Capsicum chacoense]|uniref:PHD finger protein ALFIN-LIKE 6-like n=1 Tax=Capsicum annuum TaxID=4072 RepID=UPI001FB0F971|nr:PHD finger protein ALFIN-LIKE 6-like [Capsicum annuum]XP_047258221.1 PHD finger protein ALFIN-LIKE 6-like [Capsicum annuum]XP_047258236.1 PHD finger protein ALFIN-LIKE 6-like [Capsicum annuum]